MKREKDYGYKNSCTLCWRGSYYCNTILYGLGNIVPPNIKSMV